MAAAANTSRNPGKGIHAGNLFPLDAPEFAVRFRNGAKIFRHIFRCLTTADWREFYDNLVTEEGQAGSIYQDTAKLVLYERAILRVEGYLTRDGRAPETLPTWPGCIPQHHRLFASNLLVENYGSIADGTFRIEADGKTISFVIVRDEGEQQQFFGATHHFRVPTAAQRRRFFDAISEFPTARTQRALVSLYDELAVSAGGYSFRGVPIAPEQLRREMCCGHKIYAVCAFLGSLDGCDPEPHRARTVSLPAHFLGMKNAAPAPRVEMH